MRKLLILLALCLASPARAAISFEDLRALVLARDFAGVDAALTAAHAEYADAHTPDAERDLYNVFTLIDPETQHFAKDWADIQPDNPRALTAMGWNHYSWGWTIRGEATGNHTTPEAMAQMRQHHAAAFKLFMRASKAQPDLIPASDGLLRLTSTLGNHNLIPLELERIMTSRPNRGSLMRGMLALAPQWGGRPEQVNLLCDRYAPMIIDVKDYTPAVCRIDAVYYAGFWQGDQRAAAHQLLILTPNPVLDYARHNDMMDGLMTPEETLAALQKIKSERDLALDEAEKLDWTLINANHVLPQDAKFPNFAAALMREVAAYEASRDVVTVGPDAIHTYINVRANAAEFAGYPVTAADKDAMVRQLKSVLKTFPTDARLWSDLAELTDGADALDRLAKTEPYYHNAIYYSNYQPARLFASIRAKVALVLDQSNLMQSRDISNLSPEQLHNLDEIVYCPLAAELSIVVLVCQNEGYSSGSCAEGAAENPVILNRLGDRISAGVCQRQLGNGVKDWYAKAAPVDF